MKFHAVILARGGSKGIKNKNLIKVNGRPLIYWSIKAALQTNKISKVWVSSDNRNILKNSEKYGANIIKRPSNLALDNSSSEDAWLHSIREIKKKESIDYVIVLQATSPIRGKNDLKNAIHLVLKTNADSLVSTSKRDAHFTWNKIKGKLIPNYNLSKKRMRRQSIKETFIENGSFYIFSVKKFLKYKRRLFGKIVNYNQSKIKSFEIDNKDDVLLIETIFKNVPKKCNIIK
jgi:CMP-N,N'-diacetyllegionaminic acid synthase